MKSNIIVIMGGKSVEHDVSILTGLQALKAINEDKYKVYPILITASGEWYLYQDLKDLEQLKKRRPKKVYLKAGRNVLYEKFGGLSFGLCEVHCALLCTHGGEGENGTLQGVLQHCGIPYTSSGVTSSVITMNKIMTKTILQSKGYNVVEGVAINRNEWFGDIRTSKKKIEELGYPLVIKPASLGSSIGISVVREPKELREACELCFEMDSQLLAEKYINSTELNCSALRIDGKVEASLVEKVFKEQDYLSFEDKYLTKNIKNNQSGMLNLSREVPAKIPETLKKEIQDLTTAIYIELGCEGVVRIDYLLDEDEKVYINEVNSIPGSLAFYLWQDKMDYDKLIDTLISSAVHRHKRDANLLTHFESHLIK